MEFGKQGMDIPPNLPSSSRIMRNIAEKQRRDKLNGFISELTTLVPMVASAPRKLDKISTLRLAASFLRLNQCIPEDRLPGSSRGIADGVRVEEMLNAMDMIQIVVSSSTGKILYISSNVEEIISYSQVDMLGLPIYSFVHPEDHAAVKNLISLHHSLDFLRDGSSEVKNKRCACIRVGTRCISRNERGVYEKAMLWGQLRKKDVKRLSKHTTRARHRSAPEESSSVLSNDAVFVGAIKLVDRRLPERLTLIDSLNDVYITKHTPDAKITNSDHRISTITGYLAGEVLGKSALCYISKEDLPLVGVAMKAMLSGSSGEGIIAYRLITSPGLPVYLRTRGIVEFDPATKSVSSFACVNSVINEEEWKKEVEEMKQQIRGFASEECDRMLAMVAHQQVPPIADHMITEQPIFAQPFPVTTSSDIQPKPEGTRPSYPQDLLSFSPYEPSVPQSVEKTLPMPAAGYFSAKPLLLDSWSQHSCPPEQSLYGLLGKPPSYPRTFGNPTSSSTPGFMNNEWNRVGFWNNPPVNPFT